MPRHQPLLHHRSSHFSGQTRRLLPLRNIAATLIALTTSLPLLAQESRCAVDPHDSSCALDSTLHLLHWLAIILAIILIAIVAVAMTAYRKNRNKKLTPYD